MLASDVTAMRLADESFVDFYEREVDGLVRHAALILGSAEEASDVVHDAFVGAYGRWSMLDAPRAYLYRSVINGCRERWRRATREQRALNRFGTSSGVPVHDVLWDVVAQLPLNERVAVVLRFYGGFTQSEIATHMNCPHGSVGPWIRRALNRMKEALDD